MDVLEFLIILLISTLTPTWCSNNAETDSDCVDCRSHRTHEPITVFEHLSTLNFKNYQIERLVIVLYKINGGIQLYMPNKLKQSTIPDLNLDDSDFLQPINLKIFNELFENNPSIYTPGVPVDHDDININEANDLKKRLMTRLNYLEYSSPKLDGDSDVNYNPKSYAQRIFKLEKPNVDDSSEEALASSSADEIINDPLKSSEVEFKSDVSQWPLTSLLYAPSEVLQQPIPTYNQGRLNDVQSYFLPEIRFNDLHVGNPFDLQIVDVPNALFDYMPDLEEPGLEIDKVNVYDHFQPHRAHLIEGSHHLPEIWGENKNAVLFGPPSPHYINKQRNHHQERPDTFSPVGHEYDQQHPHSVYIPHQHQHQHNYYQPPFRKASINFDDNIAGNGRTFLEPIDFNKAHDRQAINHLDKHGSVQWKYYLPPINYFVGEPPERPDRVFEEWFSKQVGHLEDDKNSQGLRDKVKRLLMHNHMHVTNEGHLIGDNGHDHWGTMNDLNLKKLIVSDAIGTQHLPVPVFYQSYLLTRGDPPTVIGFIPPDGDTGSEDDETGPEKSLKQFFEDLKFDAPNYRIIGGDPATGSGSPINNKGRSGFIALR